MSSASIRAACLACIASTTALSLSHAALPLVAHAQAEDGDAQDAAPSEALASDAFASDALPLEALVAIVGGETPEEGTDLVLLSDVELRARLDLGPAGIVVRPTRDLLAATLEEIVGELLIAREAARLHASEPSDADVRAQRDRLVSTLGVVSQGAVSQGAVSQGAVSQGAVSQGAVSSQGTSTDGEARLGQLLAAMRATEAEIDAIARRRARVDAFLRANLEGSTTISDARVEEVFASGEHPFASMTFEDAREPLRAWLAVRALANDVARWVTVLRERTIVRVLVPLGATRDGEERGVDVSR